MKPLRVCIDARLRGGALSGGTESVILGLATGLSKLTGGAEEYLFLTYPEFADWIRPYLSGPCRILCCSPGPWPTTVPVRISIDRNFRPAAGEAWAKVRSLPSPVRIDLLRSEGTIENAGVEVMHFSFQDAFLTDVPSIYHPHDLQHLHLPEFFDARWLLYREILYRTFCYQARMVAPASSWVKHDLIRQYGLAEDKVHVVPLAPLVRVCGAPRPDELAATRRKFCLPEAFVFYPAQTWPHKNHIGLLEALALLRDQHGLAVPLVSTGHRNAFFPSIVARVTQLGLEDQVLFLGVVSHLELACLYRLCRCVVIPTRFEAGSFPLWEAFLAGAPAACSHVTSLPEQAGDAALTFDPNAPAQIAAAVHRLWTDAALREALAQRGRRRVDRFTWERTARHFRAHYRRIASRPLEEEDRELLSAPPLL